MNFWAYGAGYCLFSDGGFLAMTITHNMIPYIEWKTIVLGPLTLHVWGLFVALGFLVGALVAKRYVVKRGLRGDVVMDLAVWMVAAGLVGGRLGHVLFYALPYYAAHPLEIFAIWHGGMSMFGGLIACGIVGLWYLRRRSVDVWQYADAAMFGLPFGLVIGRIGCFLIHDHPGTATDFVLGVQYPDGTIRHDFGLYEALNAAVMAVAFVFLARRKAAPGVFLAMFSIWYGLFRVLTDGGRLNDTRYLGLTSAQYLGILLIVTGGGIIVWITRKQRVQKAL